MKNRILSRLLFILLISSVFSGVIHAKSFALNDSLKKQQQFGIKWKGFVKNDFWYDSRQVLASREDLFLFYPLDRSIDKNGSDINAKSSLNFSAITTRLTGVVKSADVFHAKTKGIIEADFSGVSNQDINGFRLRLASIHMDWGKHQLLIGQFWHPLFSIDVVPQVASLNTGAPFQPFTRSPQIQYSNIQGNWWLTMAVIAQRDNVSDGPLGLNTIYLRKNIIPNLYFQMKYKSEHWVLGTALDYKQLTVRTTTDSLIKTKEQVSSLTSTAFGSFSTNHWQFKFKSFLGQNLADHLMLGGYAITKIDSTNDKRQYDVSNHLYALVNIIYGKKFQPSCFLGYARNLGYHQHIQSIMYGRGHNIDQLYRASIALTYNIYNMQFAFENEFTRAYYGLLTNKGKVTNVYPVDNWRFLLVVIYSF